MSCQSPPPTYPVTLFNFNINQSVVSYEVSLNHGHNNVAVRIEPIGGTLVDGSGPFPIVNYVQDISSVSIQLIYWPQIRMAIYMLVVIVHVMR